MPSYFEIACRAALIVGSFAMGFRLPIFGYWIAVATAVPALAMATYYSENFVVVFFYAWGVGFAAFLFGRAISEG